jgi:hypothetical protein
MFFLERQSISSCFSQKVLFKRNGKIIYLHFENWAQGVEKTYETMCRRHWISTGIASSVHKWDLFNVQMLFTEQEIDILHFKVCPVPHNGERLGC